MSRPKSLPILALFLLAFAVAAPSWAASSRFQILLNLDNQTNTGCDVPTLTGTFQGAEQILTTTVTTTASAAQVTALEIQSCVTPATDTFGPPSAVAAPPGRPLPWTVGVSNGTGGTSVIETYYPMSLSPVSGPPVVRLGVLGFDDGGTLRDELLRAQPTPGPNGPPILLNVQTQAITEIPTLSEWGLILLGFLLAALAVTLLRRRTAMAVLLALLLFGGAGIAWALVTDLNGTTLGEWGAGTLLATEPTSDAAAGTDMRAFYGFKDNNPDALSFRIDALLLFNQGPTANPQSVTTDEDTPVVITLTGSDVDGDPLTFAIGTGPTNGTLSAITPINATSAQVTYTPNADYNGADSFTFTANDGGATSAPATVSLTVDPVNDAPVANAQAVATNEDTPLVITLTGSDVDGDPLTFAIGTGPTNGTLSAITPINATSAQVTYTPNAGFNGADSFTFTANDGTATSPAATVSITVDAVNDAPVANAQSVTTNEDTPVVITLTGSDPENDPLTFAIGTGPTNGTLSAITPINATSAQVTYTPNANYNGADSFTFTANDGTTTSPAATVSITVDAVNDAPVANAQSVATNEDAPLVITLTGSDPENDPLTFAIGTGPTNGTLSAITPINATSAQVTYTPNADFNGADSFTFTASDGTATSPAATVSITVNGLNDPPVANAQAVATNEDTPLVITLTGSDTEGSPLTFAIGTGPTNGTLSAITPINATSAQVTYTPNANFNGADSFTFTVNDGTATSPAATVAITVNGVNDTPVANAQAVATNEDTPVVITLTGSDLDGDPLTFAIGTGPTNGTLSAITPINATSAQVTYTPNANYNGADSFTFTVNDGTATSPAATVAITVNAVNDTPVANAQAVATNEDTPVVITLTGSDIDGNPLTFAIGTGPTNGTLSAITPINATSAQVTYTPNANYNGADSFTFTVNDGTATSPAATVAITVNAVNDTPVANAQAVSTNEDTPVVITLTGSDIDGNPLTFAIGTGPTNGTLSAITPINATSAQVTYTPNANYNGADSFTFTVNDGTATSPAATVAITVNAVNDTPVANAQAVATNEDTPVVITLTGSDIDSDPLTFAIGTGPANGTLSAITPINATSAQVTYTPNLNYNGADSFTFTVNDGTATSPAATVSITVNAVNDPPVANLDVATITEEAPNVPALNTVSGNVLTNDTDPDGPPLVVSAVAGGTVGSPRAGSYGSVTINSNGSYTYTLDDTNPLVNALAPGQTLMDPFGYTASDGSLTSSSTLTVTIQGADDPATPDNDAFDFIGNTQLEVDRDTAATPEVIATTPPVPAALGVLDGDIDPDGGPAITIASIVGCADLTAPFDCVLAGQGTISLQADGSFSFIPEPGDVDPTATFQYTLTGNPAPGTVTLTRFARIWYVDDAGAGNGTSTSPFNNFDALDGVGGTGDSDVAGDYIFVHAGTPGVTAPIELENNQFLLGEGVGLSIPLTGTFNGAVNPTVTLVAAGTRPQVTNATGDTVRVTTQIPVEIRGLSLASTTGNAIDLTSTAALTGSAALAVTDNVFRGAGTEGVDVNLNAGTTGTLMLNLSNNSWDAAGTHTGNAVDINRAAGTLSLNFSNNTGILSAASGVSITGGAIASATITGFANNTVSGDTVGNGIAVANVTFDNVAGGGYDTVSGGTTSIGASGNPVGASALTLTGVAGDLSFTDLDLYAGNGAALRASGTGAVNTAGTGTRLLATGVNLDLIATGGPALDLNGLTADIRPGVLTSSNSATTGVSLVNVADGTGTGVTAATILIPTGSSITNATGTDFAIDGGNATVTYAGTITDDVGQLVSVANTTGDTKSFTGAITDGDDGDGSGVSLTNNTGATISFSGGLVLSTGANAAFNATGGGTVTICDENPCNPGAVGSTLNKITTTSGAALNVTNTQIGTNRLEFRSISAGTAAGSAGNGIVLDSTGTAAANGGLTVNGNGAAGTGGTIQHKTGADGSTTSGIGIYLSNTKSPSFNWMQLNDFDNSAIVGRGVQDFTLQNSVINGVIGTTNAGSEGPIMFGLSNPGGTNGLLGTGIIRNTKVSGGVEHNLEFYNQSGTMNLTIAGTNAVSEGANPNSPADDVADCIIEENSLALGGDGIQIEMQNTAIAAVVIDRCLFRDNKSQAVQISALNTSAVTATIDESFARRFDQGNEGFILQNGGDADMTVTVSNNRVNNFGGTAIFAGQVAGNATAASSLNASILNNIVTQPTTATNHGIIAFLTSTAGQLSQARLRIDGNNVTNNSTSGTTRGIIVDTPDAGTSPVFHATVTNNTVSVGDNVNGVSGLIVQSRQSGDLCANIGSNTVTFPNGTPGGVAGLRARQVAPGAYDLEQSGGCSGAAAAVLACRNPASTTEVLGTITVVPAGSCLLPLTP